MNSLEKIGYQSTYWLLNAADYGVPQFRERVFILCFHKDLSVSDYEFTIPDLKPCKKTTYKL